MLLGFYYTFYFTFTIGVEAEPSVDNFHFEECDFPELLDGQILVKTLFLSVDPYMVSES